MTTLTAFVDRLDSYVSEYAPKRALLAVIGLPFFVIGWVIGILFKALWLTGAYLFAAAAVGFDAATGRHRPTLE